jgi:beta-glucosidase
VAKMKTVYIPKRKTAASHDFFGAPIPESVNYPVNIEIAKKYFKVTDNPAEADFALVVIRSPESGSGYDPADVAKGGNGYMPISLQYREYKAADARAQSIAGGDPYEKFTNRSYRNKTIKVSNSADLDMVLDTRKAMKGKPVIVSINVAKPLVFSEFEKEADAIIINFQVQDQAIFEMITGAAEPSGLLPFQMPASMKVVEMQNEDQPFDMQCHVDSEGNTYDFGFGMNWSGIIKDARNTKYTKVSR